MWRVEEVRDGEWSRYELKKREIEDVLEETQGRDYVRVVKNITEKVEQKCNYHA